MLAEKGKLLSKQKDVASTFSKHFVSITDLSNLLGWPRDTSISAGNDKVNSIIKKFAFHQSIKAVKKKFKIKSEFSFIFVSTETIKTFFQQMIFKIFLNDIETKKIQNSTVSTRTKPCQQSLSARLKLNEKKQKKQ